MLEIFQAMVGGLQKLLWGCLQATVWASVGVFTLKPRFFSGSGTVGIESSGNSGVSDEIFEESFEVQFQKLTNRRVV